jgi:hypothetical protein
VPQVGQHGRPSSPIAIATPIGPNSKPSQNPCLSASFWLPIILPANAQKTQMIITHPHAIWISLSVDNLHQPSSKAIRLLATLLRPTNKASFVTMPLDVDSVIIGVVDEPQSYRILSTLRLRTYIFIFQQSREIKLEVSDRLGSGIRTRLPT